LSYLFIDTSYNQLICLLNGEGIVVDSRLQVGQKLSSLLHQELFQMFEAKNVTPKQLSTVLFIAGPGFYTGLRIARGLADILSLNGTKQLGFYSYDVPSLLGENNYSWITKAYRGEIFIHEKYDGVENSFLIDEHQFENYQFKKGSMYSHCIDAIDQKILSRFTQLQFTEKLIAENYSLLLSKLKLGYENREIFYFRPAEEEFKTSL
jgi:tRNA A37 threonylcarbamoyladenosine modification protein TsaB